jgi:acetate kinase
MAWAPRQSTSFKSGLACLACRDLLDMLVLRALSDRAAQEAIALFVYRSVRELGFLVAALGGLSGLVFSGGIDEHDAAPRAEVVLPLDGSQSRTCAE